MNCRPVVSFSLCIALVWTSFLTSAASPQAATATIEGIVVKIGAADVRLRFPDEAGRVDDRAVSVGGGTPIEGATIELTGIVGSDVRSWLARSGRDGKFVLRNIPSGQGYQLLVIRSPEYLPAQYGQPAPGLPGQPLALSAGQTLNNIRVALWPAAQVSGRVLDRRGKPVKAIVTAFKPWYMETWRVLSQTQEQSKTGVVARVETNDRGEYRFQGLPAGQYYFGARSTSNIQVGDVRGYTYSSYYGASGPADEPDPVDLSLGETVSNLNIVGEPMLRNVVQGQAIDRRTGLPVRPMQVYIVRRGELPEALSEIATRPASYSGPTGLLLSLFPGAYTLTVVGRGTSARVNLDVGNSNGPNLRVPLSPLTEIEGRVTIDGNPGGVFAANGAPVKVILRSMTAPVPNVVTRVRPDGTFQLRGITAGDYRVDIHPFLSAPPEENVPSALRDMYVRSLRLGKDDVLADGLHIEGSFTNRMEVAVGTNGGVVTGRILRDNRVAVVNARAILIPNSARRHGDLYKSAFTDDSGKFEIRGVPPGDYKVFAWELVEFGAWQDPHFIKLYENRGTSVRVSAGGRQSVDATLIPALDIQDLK
jgi:hypothetical protein